MSALDPEPFFGVSIVDLYDLCPSCQLRRMGLKKYKKGEQITH
jgi:hypothetical protein